MLQLQIAQALYVFGAQSAKLCVPRTNSRLADVIFNGGFVDRSAARVAQDLCYLGFRLLNGF